MSALSVSSNAMIKLALIGSVSRWGVIIIEGITHVIQSVSWRVPGSYM